MIVFLRFLLVTILILYAIRALLRYLLPMLFQSMVNKAQQGQQGHSRPNQQKPSGKINIDYIPQEATRSKVPDTEGDFVDYVEIRDKK